jgi:hypothetical protein
MAVRSTALVVFLFPVVISLFFGTMVLGEVLKEPERNLDLWPFGTSGTVILQRDAMKINGLQESYSVSQPIEITVSVSDTIFDCGDLYITIYDISKTPNEVITQSGFFGQCYAASNLVMPINDKFSETIDVPGQYQIVAEINDKGFKKTLTASEQFIVK